MKFLQFPQHTELISMSMNDILQVNSHIILSMLERKENFYLYFQFTDIENMFFKKKFDF